MKIGEVGRRTQVPTRLIRYYEQQGLVSADRTSNGYRSYDEDDVARVQQTLLLVVADQSRCHLGPLGHFADLHLVSAIDVDIDINVKV